MPRSPVAYASRKPRQLWKPWLFGRGLDTVLGMDATTFLLLFSAPRDSFRGRAALQLSRTDLLVLDELGYLPFAKSGGQLWRYQGKLT